MGTYAVTGGASGIGEATTRLLREAGNRVIVVDIAGGDVVADLGTVGGRDHAVTEIRRLAPDGLDGVATCAAVHPVRGNDAVVAINHHGTRQLLEALRPDLAAGGGSAVLIASHTAVLFAKPELTDAFYADDTERIEASLADTDPMVTYACIKRALIRWMRTNTPAWAEDGVRLNVIVPGYIQTPMSEISQNDPAAQAIIADFGTKIPLTKGPGEPENVGAAIAFLLSPAARFVAGQYLFVDGGQDTVLRPDYVDF